MAEPGDKTKVFNLDSVLGDTIPEDLKKRMRAEQLVEGAERLGRVAPEGPGTRMMNMEDMLDMAGKESDVNEVLKTRYATKKPSAPSKLPVEPPEITGDMRAQAEMADARKAYMERAAGAADDLDDVKFDLGKLEDLKKVDTMRKSPRTEVLKKLSRGAGSLMKKAAPALDVVGKASTAAALPLSLLTMEEANAGSDDVSEAPMEEYNPSPQAQQEMFNRDASRDARMEAVKRLLRGEQ